MALVQHVIVSYAISLAPKLHPFRDFLKETVPWLWSEDINKVFRETKVKLAKSLMEGIMSWGNTHPVCLCWQFRIMYIPSKLLGGQRPCPGMVFPTSRTMIRRWGCNLFCV